MGQSFDLQPTLPKSESSLENISSVIIWGSLWKLYEKKSIKLSYKTLYSLRQSSKTCNLFLQRKNIFLIFSFFYRPVNINNLRYADDTTLMAESKEGLKSLLMKAKEWKSWLKAQHSEN